MPQYGLSLRPKSQRPNAQERRRREAEREGTALRRLHASCCYCGSLFKKAKGGIEKHKARCADNPENKAKFHSEKLEVNSAGVSLGLEALLEDVGTAPFAGSSTRRDLSVSTDEEEMEWVDDVGDGEMLMDFQEMDQGEEPSAYSTVQTYE